MKLNCPSNHQQEALGYFFAGGYCPQCASFDERSYRESWHPAYYLVSGFVQRFNWRDYHAMNGDPVLAMVASEIWLHNVGRLLAREMRIAAVAANDDTVGRRPMPKCNAYSLSQTLGVPPQTVRRKVNDLIERGWVERSMRGELVVTPEGEAAFHPTFGIETLRDFIATARTLFESMGLSLTPSDAVSSESAARLAKPGGTAAVRGRAARGEAAAG